MILYRASQPLPDGFALFLNSFCRQEGCHVYSKRQAFKRLVALKFQVTSRVFPCVPKPFAGTKPAKQVLTSFRCLSKTSDFRTPPNVPLKQNSLPCVVHFSKKDMGLLEPKESQPPWIHPHRFRFRRALGVPGLLPSFQCPSVEWFKRFCHFTLAIWVVESPLHGLIKSNKNQLRPPVCWWLLHKRGNKAQMAPSAAVATGASLRTAGGASSSGSHERLQLGAFIFSDVVLYCKQLNSFLL